MIKNKKVEYDWGYMIWWLDGENEHTPDLSTAKMVMYPNTISQEHFHSNCHEFIVVNNGEIELIVNDKSIILSAEDTNLIQPNTAHYLKNNNSQNADMTIIYSASIRDYSTPK